MGIKMPEAFDADGQEWDAEFYVKGQGKEPLKCKYCPALITFQGEHIRELEDKSVKVPAYFRLRPKQGHADSCKHAVGDKVKVIASESEGLIESIKLGLYRLRLVMIKEGLAPSSLPSQITQKPDGEIRSTREREYVHSRGKLLAYLNSAKKVLELRAICDSDYEIAQYLELVFEGNIVIPWEEFYYDTERHHVAYHQIRASANPYPIAIQGVVKSCEPRKTKNGECYVINLEKSKTVLDQDDSGNRVGTEVAVWSSRKEWVSKIGKGDEVVVLGIWDAKQGEKTEAENKEKYKCRTFQTNRISLWLSLQAQIVKVSS